MIQVDDKTYTNTFEVGGDTYVIKAEYVRYKQWRITATKNGEPTPISDHTGLGRFRDTLMSNDLRAVDAAMRGAGDYVFAHHVWQAARYPEISLVETEVGEHATWYKLHIVLSEEENITPITVRHAHLNAWWSCHIDGDILHDTFSGMMEAVAAGVERDLPEYPDLPEEIRQWGYDEEGCEDEDEDDPLSVALATAFPEIHAQAALEDDDEA